MEVDYEGTVDLFEYFSLGYGVLELFFDDKGLFLEGFEGVGLPSFDMLGEEYLSEGAFPQYLDNLEGGEIYLLVDYAVELVR